MAIQNEKRIVDLVINGKSAEVSLDQVRKEVLALTREFGKLKEVDNPELYKRKAAQLRQISETYKEMRSQINGVKSSNEKFLDGMKQVAGGVFAGNIISGAWMSIKQGIRDSIQMVKTLSDELTNIEKTTNLSSEAVEQLNERLGNIDTRTSRKELREMAVEAGKVGETTEEGILKFVKDADMIKVALNELGKEGVIEIARLSKIFGEDMLEIGSAINSIGQASVATEAFQVDFLKRIASIGKAVNLTSKELLGYGAALEINGMTAEVSGTAMLNFFGDFVKNADEFGKVAGFAQGELRKLLDEKGTNAAFIAFLEKLKNGSKSTDELLKKLEDLGIDGARGAAAILTLAQNTDDIMEQQKVAVDSTGSIIAEFNKRNNNAAANFEKAMKRMEGALMPLKEKIGGFFIWLGTGLANNIGAILTIGKILITAGSAWLAYRTAVMLTYLVSKDFGIALRANTVFIALHTAATRSAAAVQLLFSGALGRSILMAKMAMAITPGGFFMAMATIVTTAVVAIKLFNKEVDNMTATQKAMSEATTEAAKSIAREKNEFDRNEKILKNKNNADAVREAALKRMIALNPEWLGGLTLENYYTAEGTKIKAQYNKELLRSSELKAKIAKVDALSGEIEDLNLKRLKAKESEDVKFLGMSLELDGGRIREMMNIDREILAKKKAINKLNEDIVKMQVTKASEKKYTSEITGETYTSEAEMKAAERAKKKALAEEKNGLKEKKDNYTKEIEYAEDKHKHIAAIENGARMREIRDAEKLQLGKKKLGIEAANLRTQEALEQQRFNEKMAALEVAALEEKKKIMLKYGKETGEINEKIAEKQLNIINERRKYEEMAFEAEYELSIQYNQQYFDALENEAAIRRIEGLITKEEYEAMLEDIEIRKLNSRLQLQRDYGKDSVDIERDIIRKRLQARDDAENFIINEKGGKVIYGGSYSGESQLGPMNFDKPSKDKDNVLSDKNYEKAQLYEKYANNIINIANTLHNIEINNMQTELNAFIDLQNKKKSMLDEQLKNGVISKEQYDEAISKMDAERAAKEKAIKIKMYQNQRKADRNQALVNGAMAIMTILAQTPKFDFGIATGLLIAGAIATTAAQIKEIDSTPVPQFYMGGRTDVIGGADGKKYNARWTSSFSDGGRFSNPTIGLIGEKGPELVVPNYIYSDPKYADVMHALEAAIYNKQFYGGGITTVNKEYIAQDMPMDNTLLLVNVIERNTTVIDEVKKLMEKPIEAYTVWNQQGYEDFLRNRNRAKELGTF